MMMMMMMGIFKNRSALHGPNKTQRITSKSFHCSQRYPYSRWVQRKTPATTARNCRGDNHREGTHCKDNLCHKCAKRRGKGKPLPQQPEIAEETTTEKVLI